MAIVRDTNVASASRGTSGSTTWSHTVSTGGVLYVYLAFYYATDPITAVTFDGVAMTQIIKETSNTRSIYCYGILNPTTGSAKTVSVTWNTSGTPTLFGGSVSYTGVKTSGFSSVTPVEVHNAGASASVSTSITSTVDNSVILGLVSADNSSINGYTNIVNVGTVANMAPSESNPLLITPAGATTVGFTSPANDWLKLIAFVVEPPVTTTFTPQMIII